MNQEKVAERISDIFNPYYASAPFFLLISVASSQSLPSGLAYGFVSVLFFSLLPMWDINRRIKRGLVADAHISRREDRIKPFLFSLVCALCGLAGIYAIDAPAALKAVSWMVVITGAIITAITTFWKISLHAAGVSAMVVALFALFGFPALPTVVFVAVVVWARLTIRRHTPSQLLAGTLIAAAVAVVVLRRFALL